MCIKRFGGSGFGGLEVRRFGGSGFGGSGFGGSEVWRFGVWRFGGSRFGGGGHLVKKVETEMGVFRSVRHSYLNTLTGTVLSNPEHLQTSEP